MIDMDAAYYTLGEPNILSGATGLRRQTKASTKTIADYLSKQDAYTMHKDVVRKFPRRRTFSKGINDLFQLDLIDISSLARYNDGYRYMLMCIDVFSKLGRIVPVKVKSAASVSDAFAKILREATPTFVQTDKGREFLNSTFRKLMTEHGILHYTSENDDIKCAVVERWNRTIMSKIFRYLTYQKTNRFIDVLPQLLKSYNSSYHASIKMAPDEVNEQNEDKVRRALYPPKPKRLPRWKFTVGDPVRISRSRFLFRKGYAQKWTEEIFNVVQRFPTHPPTYGLSDHAGEVIKGKFYAQELQKVTSSGLYKIEKILRTRKKGNKTQYYVKWLGYPVSFNSWIDDVERLG